MWSYIGHREKLAGLRKDSSGRNYVLLRDIPEQLEVSRRHLKALKQLLKDMRIPIHLC